MTEKLYIPNPDVNLHRVGRCNYCRNRPLFAWRTGTLNLTDAHCLNCGRLLDQTSRMARGSFRLIEGEDLDRQLREAATKAYNRKLDDLLLAAKSEEIGEMDHAENARKWAAASGRTHERLAKAIRNEYHRRNA